MTRIAVGDHLSLPGLHAPRGPIPMMRELLQFTTHIFMQAIMCGRIIQAGFGGLKLFSIVRAGLAA